MLEKHTLILKTMYELNRAYGWSKFIVVVPSIAIREGVYKTFQVTEEHFAEEYGKKFGFLSIILRSLQKLIVLHLTVLLM